MIQLTIFIKNKFCDGGIIFIQLYEIFLERNKRRIKMNNLTISKKKEVLSFIIKFNLLMGLYNLYLFSISESMFNLIVGSMNVGVWTFFREMAYVPANKKINKN